MNRAIALVVTVLLAGLASQNAARAQVVPAALKGKIITNSKPIDIPSTTRGLVAKLKKQDRRVFRRDDEGHWTIHFVAFFRRPLPAEQMGVVVLDGKGEAVAVAEVAGKKGQRTLASTIVVDSTESPGKKHLLRVYFARGGKPVSLAEKSIVLK